MLSSPQVPRWDYIGDSLLAKPYTCNLACAVLKSHNGGKTTACLITKQPTA